MILDWFDARQAVAVGASLANHLVPGAAKDVRGGFVPGGALPHTQKLLRWAAKEAGSLKLNLYKRAKLLSSFKWTLLEHGFDPNTAQELTHLLLMRLSAARARAAFSDSFRMITETDPMARGAPAFARASRRQRISALVGEADACIARGERAEALKSLQRALEINPDDALARNKIGAALFDLGRYQEAESELRSAIRLDRALADPHLNFGILLFSKGDFPAAQTALRRALKLAPNNVEALVGLGLTLGALQRIADAKDCFQRALRLKPGNVSAQCGLGWLAALEGRFEEAERLYRETLAVDPGRTAALAAITGLRRMTAADGSWLDAVERKLASPVPHIEQAKLRFALGKYFDDVGSFRSAFEQYRRANELYQGLAAPYDRKARTAFVDDMVAVYTRQRLARPSESASDSARPVFVVGMMRSGTSLVEQIIASHPRAAAAGELDFWNLAADKHREALRRAVPRPELARKLADSYLEILKQRSGNALRVVDKATVNSDHLGLIHSLFPRATIIYLRRDPIDACLSCYFQEFANVASFTLDLSDLAHYYREHHRLMTHWRAALPAGTLLEVPYAALVADQEAWSRRIVEFIGLEWSSRCLEFHKTERPVLTASNWQVRQRMYSSSVGRWRNYEKFIGPLLPLRNLR